MDMMMSFWKLSRTTLKFSLSELVVLGANFSKILQWVALRTSLWLIWIELTLLIWTDSFYLGRRTSNHTRLKWQPTSLWNESLAFQSNSTRAKSRTCLLSFTKISKWSSQAWTTLRLDNGWTKPFMSLSNSILTENHNLKQSSDSSMAELRGSLVKPESSFHLNQAATSAPWRPSLLKRHIQCARSLSNQSCLNIASNIAILLNGNKSLARKLLTKTLLKIWLGSSRELRQEQTNMEFQEWLTAWRWVL